MPDEDKVGIIRNLRTIRNNNMTNKSSTENYDGAVFY
jgi:hypothetical protein